MVRKMLINAQRPQELRLAIVAGGVLDAYQVAVAEAGLSRHNIYRGLVASVQPSLDAAFIDFGATKDGFLSSDDVVKEARHRQPAEGKRPRIDQLLERGRSLVVQVTKDAAGGKGAAVTTNISLAGRYLVLMPYDDVRGISRKVEDEETRAKLKELAGKLDVPPGCGFILRTAALGQTKTTLNRDLSALLRVWRKILAEAAKGKGAKLLYSDQDLIVQAVRDALDASIDEVLVDDDAAFDKAQAAMQAFMPRAKTRLVRYRERVPLFSRFGLETQIESIYSRTVTLPSGGSIVIDRTEALTAIDVNSGRATRSSHHEDTYLKVNLEAAREVARQLRLRDIGGLIVVDFIDMRASKNEKEVEKALRETLKVDKARVDVGRISHNGLLEINRQRLGTPLASRTHRPCPTCGGSGAIPSPETVSLSLLRRIEERAAAGNIGGARVALHPELADALQNGYRQELAALEREFDLRIEIIASTSLHRSQEQLSWLDRPAGEAKRKAASAPAVVGVSELTVAPDREEKPARRRRKGRGDKAVEVPIDEEPAEDAGEAAAEAAAETPAEEGKEGRRRRRRGGRRRKKAGAASGGAGEGAAEPAEEVGEQPGADVAPEPESEDEAEGAAETTEGAADSGGAAAKRRRRRRGGRRRRSKSGSAANGAADAADAAEPADAEPFGSLDGIGRGLPTLAEPDDDEPWPLLR
ncbi:MAG: Rne/Rng family ribonuclease [Acidobacteria bacterium]|nr:Rne/Rng family ribonuclease [Acidobacteriota bacterium]